MGAAEQQTERAVEAIVAVDGTSATEDDNGRAVILDQWDTGELFLHVTVDQEVAGLARVVSTQVCCSRCAGRHDLVIGDGEAEFAEQGTQLSARPYRGVGEEDEGDAPGAQLEHCLDGTGDRFAIDVQDTVDIEKESADGSHRIVSTELVGFQRRTAPSPVQCSDPVPSGAQTVVPAKVASG
jgi:hypothetical protein